MGTQEWNPIKGERLGPAWTRIVRELSDGEWKRWPQVVAAGLVSSDLLPTTVNNMLYEGVKRGLLERDGHFVHGRRIDTRRVRLVCAGPWAARFGAGPTERAVA